MLNKSKGTNKNANIYCSKDGKRKIVKIFNLAFPNSYKSALKEINLKYNFNNNFMIENYEINKLLVDNGRMKPAYGYIIRDQDIYVGFTGDTSFCKNIEVMAQKCKYLFCDCMLIKGNKKHQGIDNIEYLSQKYPSCKFIVSHLDNDTRAELKNINIKNIIVPNDLDEIIIEIPPK